MADDPWMTVDEVAAYTRMSPRTVYDAAADGRLSGCKTTAGRARSRWVFKRSDADAWLEAGRVQARPHMRRAG